MIARGHVRLVSKALTLLVAIAMAATVTNAERTQPAVANVVDPHFTVVAKLRKAYLSRR